MSNASTALAKRRNKNIIEQKYIETVLKEAAADIEQLQDERFSSRNISSVIRNARSFSVQNNRLTHKHNIRQRFDDMRRIRSKKSTSTKAHNKVIWGNLNTIIFKLAFGFTQDIRNTIANQYNIEI